MTYRLDETDWHIVHELMRDARVSASTIAEDLDVSAGTVRYRIDQLEEAGVIQGYTAVVDFERIGHLTSVFMCTVPADNREELAVAARSIPGVTSVRVLMAGNRSLQVVAVGETTEDLREVARSLAAFDIQIENEELLQTETRGSYEQFASAVRDDPVSEITTLGDDTPALELCVTEDASMVGVTLEEARRREILPEESTIVSVRREGQVIDPTEETTVESGDTVAVIVPEESREEVVDALAAGAGALDHATPP
jgi:DNA-binding Lrp family transcriptional regulator